MQTLKPIYSLLLLIAASMVSFAQQEHAEIMKALKEKRIADARRCFDNRVAYLVQQKNADSLVSYVEYAGRISAAESNIPNATKSVQQLIAKIIALKPSDNTLVDAYLERSSFYESVNQNEFAYKSSYEAFELAKKLKDNPARKAAFIESDLGTYANRSGDIMLAEKHHRNAIAVLVKEKQPDYNRLYISQNNMGTVMFYASKNDSALYYFTGALNSLKRMDTTPLNRYYRPAVLQNNMSAIYGGRGNTTEAINAMKDCIKNLRIYLSKEISPSQKDKAIHFQFEATDNLAGIYKELGDHRKAFELLYHSYQEKVKNLVNEDPDIFKSQVLLGQLFYAMKDNARARKYLDMALARLAVADGDNLYWKADTYYTLALINDIEGQEAAAQAFYEKADSLYQQSMQGNFDDIYLEFLSNSSLFYAENKMTEKAIRKSGVGYNYVLKTSGSETLPAVYQLMNMAEIFYLAGDYKTALKRSDSAIAVVNRISRRSDNLLDSVKISLRLPKVILLKEKATYKMLAKNDVAGLKTILAELQSALDNLEKRKSFLLEPSDVSVLMADHSELIRFVKMIMLDLYKLTNDPKYAEELIAIHESGLYNRIRSRLDKSQDLKFIDLPSDVQARERLLKEAVNKSLSGEGSHDLKMNNYLQAVEKWNVFTEELRKSYPRYYEMRYASIFRKPGDVSARIATGVSVVRYFFIDSALLAAVYHRNGMKVVDLGKPMLDKSLAMVSNPVLSAKEISLHLNYLYHTLWEPIKGLIKNQRVTIIPDGQLFNLNFEMLTPVVLTDYSRLAKGSLLADYTITYQYSLFLVGQSPADKKSFNTFIAFAPGFSDEVKKAYRKSITDTFDIDNAYLSLLPQPFTTGLASKARSILGGNAYLDGASTLGAFRSNAGGNHIIHIGTHAEADNVHPEFSRLIFAKGTDPADLSNSLYLFDIYNCNLAADLTVLTACESGRPGFQDGEGMVSLAHAFNYAGSESIITGLWKIDEQASAAIMDKFYEQIIAGASKDEALRTAKLWYLEYAEGRTSSPQYWAGLVLMGNVDPVPVERKLPWVWILAGLTLAGGAGFIVVRRKRSYK